MFDSNNFIRFVARLALASFVYSFVAFEPLYGVVAEQRSEAQNENSAQELRTALDTMVLSARQGRISDGCYITDNSAQGSELRAQRLNFLALCSALCALCN